MSCQSQKSCDGCACTGAAAPPVNIEDCESELLALRKRTIDLEKALASMKGEDDGSVRRHGKQKPKKLRSANWFRCESNPGMMALYIERYLNYGLTREELMSGKPIIGIAQSGSDLSPCNRYHLELVKRVREGIGAAGGIAFEFPTHPIQESSRRPTACLDRNLSYLGLVEVLFGYPLDGVVLLTGCDKTTPAALMAAATINIPAICLNVGPMLNGYVKSELAGSGMVLWKGREMYAAGEINEAELVDYVSRGAPSVGHCNTMGTASTMNALAEALGMALPGSAAIPAPCRERGHCAYETGERIVEMVHSDRKPSDIMTREAFENAIVVNTAIGGSTNAPIHINAIAKHIGVDVSLDDWDRLGFHIPLLLNMQPAGEFLGEEYFRAGGLPAIMAELLDAGKLHAGTLTCNGRSVEANVSGKHTWDRRIIKAYDEPILGDAGFLHLQGTLFDSAIMKTCVISEQFRKSFLEDPDDPMAFEGTVVVFDGPEDYHERLEDPSTPIDERSILVMRGTGPLGFPGAAEVVNMHPPGRLLREGVKSLPCIGDGRQSGTSGSPSILNASPEAAAGGNLGVLRDKDRIRVDLKRRRVDILVSTEELERRKVELRARGGYVAPESQTPWQELFRKETAQLSEGMVLRESVKYQRLAQKYEVPRHNH
ncbi:dihydroxy-acid and 6-phosphogluconate dehydratase [Aspergillus taichungensis]|uniref:Dihydroxy-acid and 6-phosphogluconate dehydratase n=1 Tax=Aspergillus taichungensis TaxID=482145 RepID=A0A2J5HG82_9EURO|nr:dihydroxy-acid and 6-phosphogluconate dehydratase [Aspergillus taichungensis]